MEAKIRIMTWQSWNKKGSVGTAFEGDLSVHFERVFLVLLCAAERMAWGHRPLGFQQKWSSEPCCIVLQSTYRCSFIGISLKKKNNKTSSARLLRKLKMLTRNESSTFHGKCSKKTPKHLIDAASTELSAWCIFSRPEMYKQCQIYAERRKYFHLLFHFVRLPVQKPIPSLGLLFAFQISIKKSHYCSQFQKLVRSLRGVPM